MALLIKTTGIEDYLSGGDANIKALIMGAPAAGKTPYASFWPDPIFADCEKGRMSIAYRKVPYAEILTVEDMDALLNMLALECKKPPAQRRYKTLVIDTIDAYQRIIIEKRLSDQKKEALSGWADWGYLDAKMTQFIAKLHQLPMNIVVNLHVKDSTSGEDDAKVTTTGPKLKGDFKDQIAAEFDLVGFMGTYWEAEDGERVLKRGIQWHADPTKPMLKDRSNTLPKWTAVSFSEEDFAELLAFLTGGMDGLDDSKVLDELETDPVVTAQPVGPLPGGAVSGAGLVPATTKKAPAAKKAAPAKPTPTPAAPPPAASSVVPTAVVVPDVAEEVPASQPAPETSGASPAPEAEQAAEPVDVLAEAEQAVAEGLGGTVISDDAAVDVSAPEAEAQVAESAGGQSWPKCGTSSTEGEEGQPGAVPGCGALVDPDDDMTQIAIFKTRTYLCPADFAAWRATSRK